METTGTQPDIPILFEDNHLLVVNKPAGVLSQEDHTGRPDLLNLCKEYIKKKYDKPGNVFLGLLHRLDQPVSGVMVFAKTSKAASRISEQIRARKVKKSYLAVLDGDPPPNGVLEHHLLKDKKKNITQVVSSPRKNSKAAKLSFQTVGRNERMALVSINLETGRAHQIRVQFAEIGTPVHGDRKYGRTSDSDIALHAHKFRLEHPTLKEKQEFVASAPDTFPWNRF
ncbi:RluA family pseudouridine synthase [Rhodohalobacter sp. SW132]|uniref:RluA family pseudouridine synthase n=1 Tax=Rhodohalobacter sp. SW132 TaxID=2293433 RepID=UPI000E2240B0|nr:RluA family pseudouridine synthase [Rhodohalobacter sp. SW132]REL38114.1 RluA family pseudouridine synthase [Rhodohalobacter sp. SW132]